MHSVTKYLGGHSDVIHGCLVVKEKELADQLHFIQNASGAVPGPQDCFLILRGIKTLHVRVQRACENALKIATFLEEHPKVGKVFYPGFKSHPGHDIAAKQMRMFGAMLSFDLEDNSVEAQMASISTMLSMGLVGVSIQINLVFSFTTFRILFTLCMSTK